MKKKQFLSKTLLTHLPAILKNVIFILDMQYYFKHCAYYHILKSVITLLKISSFNIRTAGNIFLTKLTVQNLHLLMKVFIYKKNYKKRNNLSVKTLWRRNKQIFIMYLPYKCFVCLLKNISVILLLK